MADWQLRHGLRLTFAAAATMRIGRGLGLLCNLTGENQLHPAFWTLTSLDICYLRMHRATIRLDSERVPGRGLPAERARQVQAGCAHGDCPQDQ